MAASRYAGREEILMPWQETSAVEERMRFILACNEGKESLASLCRRFGVSRPTAYKWLERYASQGPGGLVDQPPVAKKAPHKVTAEVVDAIIAARKEHHDWGPRTIISRLQKLRPELSLPAHSTVSEILREHGLVRITRRQPRVPIEKEPYGDAELPNDRWAADYKGQFRLGDRSFCYPLTISDDASRFLLKSEGLASTNESDAIREFELTFAEYGLPWRIRTDNGVPFASNAAGGLSRLSVWWIKLGIIPERIDPGQPQQNGRHERMHRTMKEAVKPQATLVEQRRALDLFRADYNEDRPHQGLGQRTPASLYSKSYRSMPSRLVSPEYPNGMVVRKLNEAGKLYFNGLAIYIAHLIAHEPIGLKQASDEEWEVYYGPLRLGSLRSKGKKTVFLTAAVNARRRRKPDRELAEVTDEMT